MPLRLQKRSLLLTFYQVAAGREGDVYDHFKGYLPEACIYKALGQFDLVSFTEIDDFNSQKSSVSHPCISSSHAIASFMWGGMYESPSIVEWLQGTPVAGIIFLEIDKWLFGQKSSSQILESIFTCVFNSENWSHDNVAFFGGIGQSELYAVVKGDSFSDLFRFSSDIRAITHKDVSISLPDIGDSVLSFFGATRTIPLVSYDAVITPKAYNKIKGDIDAEILIRCPPGLESEVATHFPIDNIKCDSVLGSNDLIVRPEKHISAAKLIEGIMNFRDFWKIHNPLLIDTETYLTYHNVPNSNPDFYTITPEEPYPELPKEIISHNPYLSHRIQAFIHRLQSDLNIRHINPAVWDMRLFPQRLLGEVKDYVDAINRGEDPSYPYQGNILELLESAEVGLAQRTEARFIPHQAISQIPMIFSDGVISPLLAINSLADFIFGQWDESYPDYSQDWVGFVFYNDILGFKLRNGEVFSLPLEAIISPMSEHVNWLTLTHEISHAIFSRLSVDEKEDNNISGSLSLILGREPNDEDIREKTHLLGEFFELFAHWYDYYHFYGGDHDYFQECIWASWCVLPIVQDQPLEYVFRSFMIFTMQDHEDFEYAVIGGKQIEMLTDKWEGYLHFIHETIPYIEERFDMAGLENGVMDLSEKLSRQFARMVYRYRNEKFRALINEPYDMLEQHITAIRDGHLIEERIENPLMLLRECRRRLGQLNGDAMIAATGAIILSLKSGITST